MSSRTSLIAAMLFVTPGVLHADTFGTGDNAFDIEFVTIGNPGNKKDTKGDPNPAGSVDYVYRIGKYEVSRQMVTQASSVGNLGITLDDKDEVLGGPRPEMPATGVNWNEAARFTNWLNTSQGFPVAYKFSAQPGDPGYNANANIELWQPGDAGYDANNLFRNTQAHFFLPSVNEWYKAAYYDSDAKDGAGGYWNFPTGSDTAPTPVASGTDPDTAVYSNSTEQGPADIMQAGGLSPYGAMGLGGNVWEWEETTFDLANDSVSSWRGGRGGVWDFTPFVLSASARSREVPTFGNFSVGFRVASIPEPSMRGDFNGDGVLDADDINDLTLQSASMQHPPLYDLTGDGLVDSDDVTEWIRADDIFYSWIGDANLDGIFDSHDIIDVLAAATYGKDVEAVWTSGDFNGNGRFSSDDVIAALAYGCYEGGLGGDPCGPRRELMAVPEPASGSLLVVALGTLVWFARLGARL